MPTHNRLCCFLALLLFHLLLSCGLGVAQAAAGGKDELQFVLVLSRHGVRSPTWSAEQLNQYSAQAWPTWDVPPGNLTSRGERLIAVLGAYYRAYFVEAGLLTPKGCRDAGNVYLWADTDERTLHTGRALLAGMLPGCEIKVNSLPEGSNDPLFHPISGGVGPPDREYAVAAVSGRIGANPGDQLSVYRPALESMQQVLLGCNPGVECVPGNKQSLLDLSSSLLPGKGDHLVELSGPLRTGSTLAEDFLLEYMNGMDKVGWGHVDESKLREMMKLHTAYFDLVQRTPYIARAQGSNMLSHVLRTMEQVVVGKAVPGAIGKPGQRVVFVVGHDTLLANVAEMLETSWLIDGYQRDDTPPGGALVFELWRRSGKADYMVRSYYMSQTLEQMRKAQPLTLERPPLKATVFLPGCSMASEGSACEWKEFQRTVRTAIDSRFVKP